MRPSLRTLATPGSAARRKGGARAPACRTRAAAPHGDRRRQRRSALDRRPDLALQQKPSKSPFLVALAVSLFWFVVGGFFAYGLISTQLAGPGGLSDLVASPSALTAALTILVPIAIFWFLALLVWRAQEFG